MPCAYGIPQILKGMVYLVYQLWVQGPLTLIPAWISNHMPSTVWGEITYPFRNFNGWTVEVWEWRNNFITHFMIDVITYPYRELKLIHVCWRGPRTSIWKTPFWHIPYILTYHITQSRNTKQRHPHSTRAHNKTHSDSGKTAWIYEHITCSIPYLHSDEDLHRTIREISFLCFVNMVSEMCLTYAYGLPYTRL